MRGIRPTLYLQTHWQLSTCSLFPVPVLPAALGSIGLRKGLLTCAKSHDIFNGKQALDRNHGATADSNPTVRQDPFDAGASGDPSDSNQHARVKVVATSRAET